jgi:hypothetical protein
MPRCGARMIVIEMFAPRAGTLPIIEIGANIKDAVRRTKERLSLFALSFVPS